MILEGVVTTVNLDGSTNVSPMGAQLDALENSPSFDAFTLRPFQSSTTYANLCRLGKGVLHVTDDVELIARSAIGKLDDVAISTLLEEHRVLVDACRWYAFEVTTIDDTEDRTTIRCKTIDQGRGRDFFGFCRAKHAVVEAAILATRTAHLPANQIKEEMEHLAVIVEKTAGPSERVAFELLREHVESELNRSALPRSRRSPAETSDSEAPQ